jgi:hypothetical protein
MSAHTLFRPASKVIAHVLAPQPRLRLRSANRRALIVLACAFVPSLPLFSMRVERMDTALRNGERDGLRDASAAPAGGSLSSGH